MSTYEIAKEVGITQKTAWIFCAKIETAIQSSGLHLLEEEVHVDEGVIGSEEDNKPGRSLGEKKPVLMMVEVRDKTKQAGCMLKELPTIKKKLFTCIRKDHKTRSKSCNRLLSDIR